VGLIPFYRVGSDELASRKSANTFGGRLSIHIDHEFLLLVAGAVLFILGYTAGKH
jgi:hypothetical protein